MEVPMIGKEDLEEILREFSTEESKTVFLKQHYEGMKRYSECLEYSTINNLITHFIDRKMYSEAVELALKENLLWKAFDICSKYLKDVKMLVEISERTDDENLINRIACEVSKNGHVEQAVSLYHKIGNLAQAGKLLADSGKVDDAFNCYDEGGHYFEALTLAEQIKSEEKAQFYRRVLFYLGKLISLKPHT